MRNLFFFLLGVTLTLLLGSLAVGTAAAAQRTECDVQLTVELTPDVPDPGDPGFLSSLLNNHPDYRLELLQMIDAALVELDLSGPGPGYLCEGVVETIRKDARVLSVRTNTDEVPSLAAISPTSERVRVSDFGLGSLYWAAHHPSKSWRVLLPVRRGAEPGDDALRASERPDS